MTTKDYKKIAETLNGLVLVIVAPREGIPPKPFYHAYTVIESLCAMMKADNPKFNRRRFIKACGYTPWSELLMGEPLQ